MTRVYLEAEISHIKTCLGECHLFSFCTQKTTLPIIRKKTTYTHVKRSRKGRNVEGRESERKREGIGDRTEEGDKEEREKERNVGGKKRTVLEGITGGKGKKGDMLERRT